MPIVAIISIHADPVMAPGVGEWGGTHAYVRELTSGLARKGRQCVLITRRNDPQLPSFEPVSDFTSVYRIDLGPVGPLDKTQLYSLHEQSKSKTKSILVDLAEKPFVLHSVYWNSGQVAMELSEEFGVPFVHSVISNSIRRRVNGRPTEVQARESVERMVFTSAYKIVCITKSEKQDLIDFYGIPSAKIIITGREVDSVFAFPYHDEHGQPRQMQLTPNILPSPRFHFLDSPTTSIEITSTGSWWLDRAFTYVGRMSEDKGVAYILLAWHDLFMKYQDQCPPLWLVGGSPNEIETLRSKVSANIPNLASLEQTNKIVWWGYLEAPGISTLLLKSLVLIAHSRYEPGGRIIMEALSEGVPVIATPNGFALDYVANWFNGFLVPFGDVKGLSGRLEHFLLQPLLRNCLGMNAKDFAAKVRDGWNFLNKHCEVYDSVLASTKPNPLTSSCATVQNVNTIDAFKHRFLSTYPYATRRSPIATVEKFIEDKTKFKMNKIEVVYPEFASSFFWRAECTGVSLIIKQSYTRLSLRPLWDINNRRRLVDEGEARFKTELFSSEFPGIAPVIAFESKLRFVARSLYKQIPKNQILHDLLSVIVPIRKLQSVTITIPNLVMEKMAEDWGYAEFSDINDVVAKLHESFSIRREFFDSRQYLSLRIAWRYLELLLAHHGFGHCISREWAAKALTICHTFSELAKVETSRPVVLTHGSTEVRNVVANESGEYLLIDGEHIHVASFGKDIAILLADLLDSVDQDAIAIIQLEHLLDMTSYDSIERNLILSWLGVLTFEEILRNSSMLKVDATHRLTLRFEMMSQLAEKLV